MGLKTRIGWAHHSLNFWVGCFKISPGCKFCYFYREYENVHKKDAKLVKQVQMATINKVLKNAQPGDRIFTCSWSDFFLEEADQFREWAWDIIKAHPQFTWMILTKRPERIAQCLPKDWGEGWPQVWLGASAENQKLYDERMLELLRIPAAVHFVSLEPLISPVYIDTVNIKNDGKPVSIYNPLNGCFYAGSTKKEMLYKLDWIIAGGESGNDIGEYQYRPMEESWLLDIVKRSNDTALFIKQFGRWLAKRKGFKDSQGAEIQEFPKWAQRQEFPEVPAGFANSIKGEKELMK